MKREILTLAALLWASSASALTNSGHCDSKPFTLKKPTTATPAPKIEAAPVEATAPKQAPLKKPVKIASSSSKKRYVLGCKQPKG